MARVVNSRGKRGRKERDSGDDEKAGVGGVGLGQTRRGGGHGAIMLKGVINHGAIASGARREEGEGRTHAAELMGPGLALPLTQPQRNERARSARTLLEFRLCNYQTDAIYRFGMRLRESACQNVPKLRGRRGILARPYFVHGEGP